MRALFYLAVFVLITASYSQITTVKNAKSFFFTKEDSNILLISATLSGSAVVFAFEDSTSQQVDSSILSSIILNKDTWTAYLTYSDSTKQEVPYLGSTLGLTENNVVNSPYSDCPLTALLTFTTKVPGRIEITIVGRDANSVDFTHRSKQVTTSHSVPVVGLYADFENEVIVKFVSPTGVVRVSQTVYIQTAATTHLNLDVTENKLSTANPHFFMVGEAVFDEQGYVRWYVSAKTSNLFPLSGGLIAQIIPTNITNVYVRDFSGQVLQKYYVPNGAHHEVIEKTPGGNLLVLSNEAAGVDSEDHIVEIDRKTGAVVKDWDMADYFQRDRPKNWISQVDTPAIDWFHENAVSYDPTDNTLLISGRHQDMVTKIGYDDGTVKWILGNHQNWTAPYTDYLLTPTNFNTTLDVDQDWIYLQHHPRVLPNGDILLYDNGGTRPGFTNNPNGYSDPFYAPSPLKNLGLPAVSGYARAVQYSVDPDTMTVTKVMEFTNYPDYPTTIVGSVHYLQDNILMITYGEVGKMTISNINTGELLYASTRNVGYYRSYPMQFYSGEYTLL